MIDQIANKLYYDHRQFGRRLRAFRCGESGDQIERFGNGFGAEPDLM